MEPNQTGSRIVSKSEYVKAHTERAALRLFGTLLIFVMIFCGLVTTTAAVIFVVTAIFAMSGHADIGVSLVSCCVTLFCAALTNGCWRTMEAAAIQADNIHPGIPLTRASAADLLPPDTLVRASSEPVQAQEAVLLRAAEEGLPTPPEQLVRAVSETEQD